MGEVDWYNQGLHWKVKLYIICTNYLYMLEVHASIPFLLLGSQNAKSKIYTL